MKKAISYLIVLAVITMMGISMFGCDVGGLDELIHLIPTVPRSTQKTSSTDSAEATISEINKFREMTSQELEDELFSPASYMYESFNALGGFFEFHRYANLNDSYSIQGDDDWTYTYYAFEHPQYKSLEDLKREICKYFTKEFADDLIDNHCVENTEGKLYVSAGARGGNSSHIDTTYSVDSYSYENEEIVFKQTHIYVKDEFYEDYWSLWTDYYTTHDYSDETGFFEMIPKEYFYEEIDYCPLVKEDGRWVFRDFSIGY